MSVVNFNRDAAFVSGGRCGADRCWTRPGRLKPNRMTPAAAAPRRNRGFEETHRELIETAVRLISESGAQALSIAAVARAAGVNRTTVYYHFESRETLIAAVKAWSAEQLAKAFKPFASQAERIDYITRFVLEKPELMKLWIEDFLAPGDVRDRYPYWDALVDGIREALGGGFDETVDAEVYSAILMTGATIGPRVFKNSIRPEADIDTVVRRFRGEWLRFLKQSSLLRS
jgi:AcrR family transcriptional regulator